MPVLKKPLSKTLGLILGCILWKLIIVSIGRFQLERLSMAECFFKRKRMVATFIIDEWFWSSLNEGGEDEKAAKPGWICHPLKDMRRGSLGYPGSATLNPATNTSLVFNPFVVVFNMFDLSLPLLFDNHNVQLRYKYYRSSTSNKPNLLMGTVSQ